MVNQNSPSLRRAAAPVAFLSLLTLASSLSAALTATVAQWGSNFVAQANRPGNLTNISAIAAGRYHALAARSDGTVVGWGDTNWNKHLPPAELANVTAVAAGYNHSLALRSDGSVVTWGDPTLTNTPGFGSTYPAYAIAAGEYFSLALWGAGYIAAWGAALPANTPTDSGYTAIAAGRNFGVAVKPVNGTGRVSVWGYGAPPPPTLLVNGSRSTVAVAAGDAHCLALLSDGTVVVWGNNFFGQWNQPAGVYNILGIAAYGNYSLARRNDGAIFAWGENYLGASSPPAGLSNVVAIAGGEGHGMALYWEPLTITSHPQSATSLVSHTASFSVAATGSQPYTYQWHKNGTNLANATNATYTIADVQTNHAGSYSVTMINPVSTLTSSSAVLTVYAPPTIVTNPQNQSVAQGGIATFSVTVAGTTPFEYQWRKNGTNLPGANIIPLYLGNAQPADAGSYSVVVSNVAGSVTSAPASLVVLLPPTITQQPQSQTVVVGSAVTFSVAAEGATKYQWLKNNQIISSATNAAYIINSVQTNDAGTYKVIVGSLGGEVPSQNATLLVLTPGTNSNLVAWGQTSEFNGANWVDLNPPPGISNAVAIAVGGAHSLALLRDGTVTGWGDNTYGQAAAPALTGIKAIAAGQYFSVALRSNGTVAAWGQGHLGQTNVPAGLNGVTAIAAGANHALALRTNGVLVAWGDPANGKASVFPTATNVVAIAAGKDHTVVARADGTVVAWGGNAEGQIQTPLGLTNVIAVAAGDTHTLVLRRDGTLLAWGGNSRGQTNIPAAALNVMAIAVGGAHNLALRRDNQVVAWGHNNYGQTDVPGDLAGVAAIAAGPARSLAIKLKPLRLQPLQLLSGGRVRLEVGNADGSALESNRLARLQVRISTNALAATNTWLTVTNAFTLSGDRAVFQETNQPPPLLRFFLVTEQP